MPSASKIDSREQLGMFLQKKRIEANLSQSMVSNELGYSTSQLVSNWERGVCLPPVNRMLQLSHLLGIAENDLFEIYMTVLRTETYFKFFGMSPKKKLLETPLMDRDQSPSRSI